VIKIAEDEQAQLNLVDSFIDSTKYTKAIQKLCSRLTALDKKLAQSIKASSEVAAYQRELNTIEEQLKNIDRSLKDKLFDEMKLWESKKETIEKHLSFHDDVVENVDQMISSFEDEAIKPDISSDLHTDPQIRKAKSLADASFDVVLSSLEKAKDAVLGNKTKLVESFEKWYPKFERKRTAYEEVLKKAGGDKRQLEGERRKLEADKRQVEEELRKHSKKLASLEAVKSDRDKLLDDLERVQYEYYTTRKRKFDDLSSQSDGKLSLELRHAGNTERFKEQLLFLRTGSRVRSSDIDKVVRQLSPRVFIDYVISNDVGPVAEGADIAQENAEKLIHTLNAKEALEDVLALAHSAYPEDVPSIKFRKEDGSYKPLSELSVGQKCTALLIIALSEGTRPIIIDQPEDSLDNPSVYEDVVSKLRAGKEARQFILTTHNSSVGVASDSDTFIVLKATAVDGDLECCGAIDRPPVRSEVIKHLEGGSDPYRLKSKKYNIRQ
jgi:predicted  nucleic acid-binding Zn-ribbon protein